MMTGMANDSSRLREETDRLVRIGRALSREEWDAPSLCAGWRVRDVFGHLTLSFTYPLARVTAVVARHGGNVDRASAAESRRLASSMGQTELLDRLDRGRRRPKGLARFVKPSIVFGDSLIHELDIRRPLALVDPIPPDLLHDALTLCTRLSTRAVPAAKRVVGLDLHAIDVGWSRPSPGNPQIEGAAEDMILAIGGRPEGLRGLEGDGVAVLAARIGARLHTG